MSSFDRVFSYTLFFLLFISFTNCGTCKTSNSLEFCNINSDTMTQRQSGGSCLSDCSFVACVCYLTHMARFSICTAFLKVILCISSTVLSASASIHFLVLTRFRFALQTLPNAPMTTGVTVISYFPSYYLSRSAAKS